MLDYIPIRPRRNRAHPILRALVQEHHVPIAQLVFPLFVQNQSNKAQSISSMPHIMRHSTESVLQEIADCMAVGIHAFALFPCLEEADKTPDARASIALNGLYLHTIQQIKARFPAIWLIGDVAMDPYTCDGHDGVVDEQGRIDNDRTLPILADMALAQAQAGISMVAPSDMMDGRVGYIRQRLDEAGYTDVGILSYTAKYASALYGPFRDALQSAPRTGDKKTYQMAVSNSTEAMLEASLDAQEGADILMVKPAGLYLDVLYRLAQQSNLPIAAYQVSGEYAMAWAAAQQQSLDIAAYMCESLLSIRRAGARLIFTYFAKQYAQLQGATS